MLHTWRIPTPQAIISVTGAARDAELNESMSDKARLVFRRGLQSAARMTRAWIITGGFNSGVMAAVGATVNLNDERRSLLDHERRDRSVCLGICSWRQVHRKEELEKHARGKILPYPRLEVPEDRGQLDMNHSHFLLVDGGEGSDWGAEVGVRAAVEDALCSRPKKRGGLDTPRVLLVVNGGLVSLEVVLAALKRAQPVVALADSGGAAGHLADLWHDEKMPSLAEVEKRVRETDKQQRYLSTLCEIVRIGRAPSGANRKAQLTFFWTSDDIDSANNELDSVIMQAILSDCDEMQNAIQHAVMWGHATVVEEQLRSSKQHNPLGLCLAFEHVLLQAAEDQDNEDALRMVELLLQFDVEAKWLDFGRLWITKVLPTYNGSPVAEFVNATEFEEGLDDHLSSADMDTIDEIDASDGLLTAGNTARELASIASGQLLLGEQLEVRAEGALPGEQRTIGVWNRPRALSGN